MITYKQAWRYTVSIRQLEDLSFEAVVKEYPQIKTSGISPAYAYNRALDEVVAILNTEELDTANSR